MNNLLDIHRILNLEHLVIKTPRCGLLIIWISFHNTYVQYIEEDKINDTKKFKISDRNCRIQYGILSVTGFVTVTQFTVF